jgi:hypothetical protein
LARYDFEADGHALGTEQRLGTLPGRYTETLRLDRLE